MPTPPNDNAATPPAPAPKATDDATAKLLAAAQHEKTLAEAERDALKAKYGNMPKSDIKGDITAGSNAGAMEAALLSSRALRSIAADVATVARSIDSLATIHIYPGEIPDLKQLRTFRAFCKTTSAETNQEAIAPVVAVGLAIEAVSSIMSFFRTDFTLSSNEVSVDNLAFAKLVAGELLKKPAVKVRIPSLYNKPDEEQTPTFLTNELQPLFKQREEVAKKLAALEEQAAATPPASTAAADHLRTVITNFDAMMATMRASGALDVLFDQYAIEQAWKADGTYLLSVKVEKAGGTSYTCKNFWTLLGAIPFKTMGGAIVSYSLIDPRSGQLLAADMLADHGGYHAIDVIADLFTGSAPAPLT